ncbi:phosphate ABC transporter substrate-binding protein [Oribacterium parvum]|uniref:phosphate ABC transporter substrate-binding protein n=1 Tax=Oribacterium parvum TaxID=1501329 RepID=UPI0028DBBC79|nr:phosphate ABC transporter substrate-binding protein [Oribacterium parvum]
MKRILAIVVLVFILLTLLHFLYTAFTGGSKESLLAHLFLLMIVPAVFYVLQWVTNLIRRE